MSRGEKVGGVERERGNRGFKGEGGREEVEFKLTPTMRLCWGKRGCSWIRKERKERKER